MNEFWKGLVASIVIYQLILTYIMFDVANYLVWMHFDIDKNKGLLDTQPGRMAAMVLGGTLIVLVAINFVNLYHSTRSAQDG
jgi:hypothetical protein